MATLCPKGGNDKVYTPDALAMKIVQTILRKYPELEWTYSSVLEPCAGNGAFVRALAAHDLAPMTCEIDDGTDFMDFSDKVDWIVTNPPWSKIRDFLNKSMEVAHDIFFLAPIPSLMTKARLRDIHKAGFHFAHMWLVDTPKEFPQSGFQLVVAHISDRYNDSPFMEAL
jgi:predicted RNA methylase